MASEDGESSQVYKYGREREGGGLEARPNYSFSFGKCSFGPKEDIDNSNPSCVSPTGRTQTQKLRDLNTEIVSSTLPRQDQAFERPQRPMESPATPTFMPEVKARGARGGRQSDEVSK